MSSGSSWVGAGYGSTPNAPAPPANFDLRPLSTGEILDRTFQIYRSRFTLFAGVAVLPAGVSVVTQAIRLWYAAHQGVHVHHGADLHRVQIITGLLTLASAIITLVLYGITQAATTWAVSSVYLGEPASIGMAYSTATRHWFRYTLIVLRQVWAGFWLPTALIISGVVLQLTHRHSLGANGTAVFLYLAAVFSLIYAVWAYIRLSLAVPAAVIESLNVRGSLRRSKQLLIDRKFRIFLLFVFLFALYMVIGAIETPLTLLALKSRGSEAFIVHAISLALSFVIGTLVGPIGAIAICLFYIDERVRREGFDIEWMMGKIAPAAPPASGLAAAAGPGPLPGT
jgi:hypothetical protein